MDAGLDQELNRPIWYAGAPRYRARRRRSAGPDRPGRLRRGTHTTSRRSLFDHLIPATAIPNVSTAEHKALAREIAEQSTVLLKNDGVLPSAEMVRPSP